MPDDPSVREHTDLRERQARAMDEQAQLEVRFAHKILDDYGVPREECAAQGGGICPFTLAGRMDWLVRRERGGQPPAEPSEEAQRAAADAAVEAHGRSISGREVVAVMAAVRAAYAIDRPSSESLMAEEAAAVLRWLNGTTPRTYPAEVADGRLLDKARDKLRSLASTREGEADG